MKTHPLKQLIEMYLKQLKLSDNTIKSYRIALKYYVMYLKEHKIKYPKTRDIIQFRNERFELGFSVAYNHIFMSAIKGLYQYLSLHSSNLIIGDSYAYDIAKPIKQIQMKHHVTKKVLTVKEARHFLMCTKKFRRDIHHYRDHAIIALMLTSGLSPDEIIHARKSNFKYREGQKTLFVNKKGAMRYQYKIELSFQTYLALKTYVLKRGDTNPYLFMSHRQVGETKHLSRTFFRDMFRRNLKACGFDERFITPHALRHTAALFYLESGGTLESTKMLLRHEQLSQTKVYETYLLRRHNDAEEKIETLLNEEIM